jgi:MoaA/NifB/PqqE/SkfB family radical SAM enzyme
VSLRKTIHWQLTFDCNLACQYCWNATRETHPQTLDCETIIEQLATLNRLKQPPQIILTGGEPLLHPGVEPIVEQALGLDLPISLFTNGSTIDETRVAWLRAMGAGSRLRLIISIDAVDAETEHKTRGTRKTWGARALRRLARGGFCAQNEVLINTVLTRHNLDHLEPVLELACDQGAIEHRLDLGIVHPIDAYADTPQRALELHALDLRGLDAALLKVKLDQLDQLIDRYRNRLRLLPRAYYATLRRYLVDGRLPDTIGCEQRQLVVISPSGVVRGCFEKGDNSADLRKEALGALLERVGPGVDAPACASPRCICSFVQVPPQLPRRG